MTSDVRSRALGALYGLAIGDALGLPTQMLSRGAIQRRYGVITGFVAPDADHPIAAGQPAGSVTDDTEQAVLVGRLVVDGDGHVDAARLAQELVAWEQDMIRRGSRDLLGPSTSRAVSSIVAGCPPSRAGLEGATNGAAMRIAPVGVAVPCRASADLDRLVRHVVEVSQPTHNTSVAMAGAAAVAAAVSAGIDGAGTQLTFELAIAAAELAETRAPWVAGARVADRIRWAISLVEVEPPERLSDTVYRLIGTSLATQESVPAAFALLAGLGDDPWQACLAAASIGGDCDTIAAIVGAMAGASHGLNAFPSAAVDMIDTQHLRLQELADGLLRLRTRQDDPPSEHDDR